ncbi:hypothetical protein [Paractinoplanes rishiriensis]|uniref:Uncharacterized protein n=1 Tax=Paractinoplanes rishiriensis TaxID=1050105 RepID=A0A919K5Q2_9ACTN|nr:hypothetical protein [Actinoplanes rishiriensis]GIF00095.1 hypothetical protein Ari01nite_75590 [Actinoplanes rishiriensis]
MEDPANLLRPISSSVGPTAAWLTRLFVDHERGQGAVLAPGSALERRAAEDPAFDAAIRPLLELAAGLRTDTQVRALLAYVTEQVYAARWRRR